MTGPKGTSDDSNQPQQSFLDRLTQNAYVRGMTRIFDMDDRARLRERFYGEARSILARL